MIWIRLRCHNPLHVLDLYIVKAMKAQSGACIENVVAP